MRPLPLLAAALLLPLAGAAAEEPATLPLDTWSVVWRAGDVATVSAEETMEGTVDVTHPGGTQKRVMSQKDAFTYVQKCLVADDKGAASKSLVFVRAWSHVETATVDGEAQPSEPDSSLEGVHLEVEAKGEAHSYRVLTAEARPSDEATKWLDKKFGKKAKERTGLDLDRMGRPKGPVKVGDSWDGDPTKLDMEGGVDAEASTVRLTLAEVKDGVMRLPVEMKVKLRAFPLGENGSLPFSEGGAFDAKATITHSLAPGTFDSQGDFEGTMTGTAGEEGGLVIRLDLRFKMRGQSRTGGELPPAPGAK